jgi:hypothetical protein
MPEVKVKNLIEDLAFVLKSMQEHPERWESEGAAADAQPLVEDLYDIADDMESEEVM